VRTPMRTRAILECLVVQAEGGGIGDGVEPRAAWPGGYTVQESAGPVTGQKAHQLSVVGFMEGAAYDCGQLSELTPLPHQVRRSQLRDAGRDPGAAVYVPPGLKCGSVGGFIGSPRAFSKLPEVVVHFLRSFD
jgi:hypothetical protein